MMYERFLDKNRPPAREEMVEAMGTVGAGLLADLEAFLRNSYDVSSELRFPFGNDYGWGMKYSHKSKHLCYVFFEKGAFTVMIQLGKNELPRLNKKLPLLSSKTRELWVNRYPCGEGGWLHYRVLDHADLNDIKELICIKKTPLGSK